ncbi:Ycf48-like protein [bioreactor metagenome]|uniref:Ycf48-like protein n=1 Tax=bioreactor metagenome TaxID=1076179 RepID=A0A644UB18_9ZZZZ|nr:YCF48-related protein [Lentimicrobium sp.]MEA5111500.1 YCF48-related protein [Lentimicrobium sp.]
MKLKHILIILSFFCYLSTNAQWQKVSQVNYSGCGWDLGIGFYPGNNSFDFVNNRIGYITVTESCGGPGTYDPTYLLKSSDWGASWEHIYTTGQNCCQYSRLVFSFYEVDNAYLLECNDGMCRGIDYSGNNIGISTEPPLFIMSISEDSLLLIDWINHGDHYDQGIVYFNPMDESFNEIIITNEYHLVYQEYYQNLGPVVNGIYFDENIGVVTANKNDSLLIFWSDRNWQNWQYLKLSKNIDVQDIHFINDSIGFIIDNDSCLYKTIDRCENWECINLPTNETLRAAEFRNNVGYVIGNNGTLIESNDMGSSWHEIDLPTNKNLIEISIASDSVIYVLDSDLNIYCNNRLTGLSEFEKHSDHNIHIYPVPTSDKIIVESTDLGKIGALNIFNFNGELLYNLENVNSTQIELELNALSNGMYFIMVNIENRTYYKKIIKD